MKIYELEFTAYELREDDGGGMRSNVCGYTHSFDVANSWKNKSSNWRSFELKTIKHRYTVSESLEDEAAIKLDQLVQSAKSKLTKEELAALIKSSKNA